MRITPNGMSPLPVLLRSWSRPYTAAGDGLSLLCAQLDKQTSAIDHCLIPPSMKASGAGSLVNGAINLFAITVIVVTVLELDLLGLRSLYRQGLILITHI